MDLLVYKKRKKEILSKLDSEEKKKLDLFNLWLERVGVNPPDNLNIKELRLNNLNI